jgi:hypothetical protein
MSDSYALSKTSSDEIIMRTIPWGHLDEGYLASLKWSENLRGCTLLAHIGVITTPHKVGYIASPMWQHRCQLQRCISWVSFSGFLLVVAESAI